MEWTIIGWRRPGRYIPGIPLTPAKLDVRVLPLFAPTWSSRDLLGTIMKMINLIKLLFDV
jgi:hypothetical protein